MEQIARLGLELDTTKFAAQPATRTLNDIRTSAKAAGESLDTMGNLADRAFRLFRGAVGASGIALGARQLVDYAEQWKVLEGRLKLVTNGSEELSRAQQRLFATAQNTRSAFQPTVELYTRIARSTTQLGATAAQVAQVVETTNKAIRVSGASSTEASAGLLQLGQALASGALRGDELNSVLEQLPRLAQAIADGIGVTVGQLRTLGAQGKLTSADVFKALLSQQQTVDAEFAQIPKTVSEAFTQVNNNVLRTVGTLNQMTGATTAVADALSAVAGNTGLVAGGLVALAARGLAPVLANTVQWTRGQIEATQAAKAEAEALALENAQIVEGLRLRRDALVAERTLAREKLANALAQRTRLSNVNFNGPYGIKALGERVATQETINAIYNPSDIANAKDVLKQSGEAVAAIDRELVPAMKTAEKTAAAAAGAVGVFGAGLKGLKAGAAGLIDFLGGSYVVAFTAAAGLLTYLASRENEATKYANEHVDAIDRKRAALDRENGVLRENADLTARLSPATRDATAGALAESSRRAQLARARDEASAVLGDVGLSFRQQFEVEFKTFFSGPSGLADRLKELEYQFRSGQVTAAQYVFALNNIGATNPKLAALTDDLIKQGLAAAAATDRVRELEGGVDKLSKTIQRLGTFGWAATAEPVTLPTYKSVDEFNAARLAQQRGAARIAAAAPQGPEAVELARRMNSVYAEAESAYKKLQEETTDAQLKQTSFTKALSEGMTTAHYYAAGLLDSAKATTNATVAADKLAEATQRAMARQRAMANLAREQGRDIYEARQRSVNARQDYDYTTSGASSRAIATEAEQYRAAQGILEHYKDEYGTLTAARRAAAAPEIEASNRRLAEKAQLEALADGYSKYFALVRSGADASRDAARTMSELPFIGPDGKNQVQRIRDAAQALDQVRNTMGPLATTTPQGQSAYNAVLAGLESRTRANGARSAAEAVERIGREANEEGLLSIARQKGIRAMEQYQVTLAGLNAVRGLEAGTTPEERTRVQQIAEQAERERQQRKYQEDAAERLPRILQNAATTARETLTGVLTNFIDGVPTAFERLAATVRRTLLQLAVDVTALKIGDRIFGKEGPRDFKTLVDKLLGENGALTAYRRPIGVAGAGLVGFGAGYAVGGMTSDRGTGAIGGALSGAASGAMIGSVIPGVGPAIGAVAGAVTGLVGGLIGSSKKAREEAKALDDARRQYARSFDAYQRAAAGLTGGVADAIRQNSTSATELARQAAGKYKGLKFDPRDDLSPDQLRQLAQQFTTTQSFLTGALRSFGQDLLKLADTAQRAQDRLQQEFRTNLASQLATAQGDPFASERVSLEEDQRKRLNDANAAGRDLNETLKLLADATSLYNLQLKDLANRQAAYAREQATTSAGYDTQIAAAAARQRGDVVGAAGLEAEQERRQQLDSYQALYNAGKLTAEQLTGLALVLSGKVDTALVEARRQLDGYWRELMARQAEALANPRLAEDLRRQAENEQKLAQAREYGAAALAAELQIEGLVADQIRRQRQQEDTSRQQDLQVRALAAIGQKDRAEALGLFARQQQEIFDAQQQGYGEAYLATLRYVQALEAQAQATERATQRAKENADTQNSFGVETLRLTGRSREADALAFTYQQQTFLDDLAKKLGDGTYTQATVDQGRLLAQLRAADFAEQQRNVVSAQTQVYGNSLGSLTSVEASRISDGFLSQTAVLREQSDYLKQIATNTVPLRDVGGGGAPVAAGSATKVVELRVVVDLRNVQGLSPDAAQAVGRGLAAGLTDQVNREMADVASDERRFAGAVVVVGNGPR